MGTGKRRPTTADAIMAALTVPHHQDAGTPQYANVIDGLHAAADAINRLTEVIWHSIEAQSRPTDQIIPVTGAGLDFEP